MWSSIRKVLQPESLEQAATLASSAGHALLAGGTYLVSEKPETIHTLVRVEPLLKREIEAADDRLTIYSGATLQNLVDQLADGQWSKLAEAAKASCSSKQLRNRRTIGGEIARKRANSELWLALLALDAQLGIAGKSKAAPSIRKWDGKGLISEVTLSKRRFGFQRFALLPSAPAFVAVAAAKNADNLEIAVGGKSSGIHFGTLKNAHTDADLEKFAGEASGIFKSDHYGSVEYKRHLVKVAVKRIGSDL